MRKNDFVTLNKMTKRVNSANGKIKADLVLKNARFINVFTESIDSGDIAITDGVIVGIGKYSGKEEIDVKGKILSPGFIDGHIHLESAIVSPANFRDAVIPHGTSAVITDPHEITNVAGVQGIDFILDMTEKLDIDVYVVIPSCVPSTSLDEAGAVIEAKDIKEYYKKDRVIGLAEFMNSYGIYNADKKCLAKCVDCINSDKVIDGHAPDLTDKNLNAYLTACISTDHECSNSKEAIEKLKKGQWIEIRQGTVCHDLKQLMPLLKFPYYNRCMFSTDDKHPGDIIEYGHIDYIIKKAIEWGADPIVAIKVATYNAALHYNLKNQGAIAVGYKADIVVLDNLKKMKINSFYKNGVLVAKDGKALQKFANKEKINKKKYNRVYNSFNLKQLKEEDFIFKNVENKENINVIQLIPGGVLTKLVKTKNVKTKDEIGVNLDKDIVKLAVIERHHNTGHIGLSLISGYGIKKGAVASSVSHDSHNIIVVGTNAIDMSLAANTVRKNKGGLAVVCDGKVLSEIAFEIAGLMTDNNVEVVETTMNNMKKQCYNILKINKTYDPFMTLAFISLPVIPEVKLTTKGLCDVNNQKIINTFY